MMYFKTENQLHLALKGTKVACEPKFWTQFHSYILEVNGSVMREQSMMIDTSHEKFENQNVCNLEQLFFGGVDLLDSNSQTNWELWKWLKSQKLPARPENLCSGHGSSFWSISDATQGVLKNARYITEQLFLWAKGFLPCKFLFDASTWKCFYEAIVFIDCANTFFFGRFPAGEDSTCGL